MDAFPSSASDALLRAWLTLTSTIWNTRLMSAMPYNEAHVLGLLAQNAQAQGDPLSATALIRRTGLLKSQMNKVLAHLEAKGYILRMRDPADRRVALIRLTPAGEAAYDEAHASIEALMDKLIARIGEERALHIAQEIDCVVQALDSVLT